MAHILFVSSYFPPEKAAGAVCVSEAATRLLKWGHTVTVLTTFPNYPTGVVYPEYRGHLMQEEMLNGVRVVRTWSSTSPNKGFLRRILAYLSFACLAVVLGARAVGHPDLIIVHSPPLFTAIAGRLLAWWKRCPFIFIASDIWPESAIQLGVLRNRTMIWLSEWLERSTYERASLVWVVTEHVHTLLLKRGLPQEKLFLLPYGVDTKKFHPVPRAQARSELGWTELDWDDRFTVMYAGNHGLMYSMMTILDVANQLEHHTDIHFVLVGDGAQKAAMVAEAHRRQLENVTFLDPIPHEQVSVLQSAADLLLVPIRNCPIFETSIPIKTYEIMACARPFIAGAQGITRKFAQQAQAAIVVEPEDAGAFAEAILFLRDHPDQAREMGQRGRAYVEDHFEYDHLIAILHMRITQLLGKGSVQSGGLTPALAVERQNRDLEASSALPNQL